MAVTKPVSEKRTPRSNQTMLVRSRIGGLYIAASSVPNALTWVAVFSVAVLLRMPTIGSRGIYTDEALSVLVARQPLDQVVNGVLAEESHPPLYHIMLALWMHVAGGSPASVRIPSLIAGSLCVVAAGLFATEFFGPKVGWLTALILLAAPFQIWYSQVARMYTLVTLWAVLSAWFFARLVLKGAGWPSVAGWAVVSLLMVYTHYYGFLLLLAEGIVLVALAIWRRKINWHSFGTGAGIIAVAYLPWAVQLASKNLGAYSRPSTHQVGGLGASFVALVSTFDAFIVGDIYPSRVLIWFVVPALLLGVGLALVGFWSMRRRAFGPYLVALLAVPIVAASALAFLVPKFGSPRYLILVSPFLYISLADGIEVFKSKFWTLVVLVAVGCSFGVSNALYFANDDDHGLVASAGQVESKMMLSDLVIHLDGSSMLPYLYYGIPPQANLTIEQDNEFGRPSSLARPDVLTSVDSSMVLEAATHHVWVVDYRPTSARNDFLTGSINRAHYSNDVPQWLQEWLGQGGFHIHDVVSYSGRHSLDLAEYVRTG